jgi:hypothetical protein
MSNFPTFNLYFKSKLCFFARYFKKGYRRFRASLLFNLYSLSLIFPEFKSKYFNFPLGTRGRHPALISSDGQYCPIL